MIAFGHSPRVQIYRDPGLYFFTGYSATGKTYLAKLVSQASEGGYPFVRYSFDDYRRGLDLTTACERCKAELVIIDRYDMYCDDAEVQQKIISISKKAVVLVDLKTNRLSIEPDDYVVIDFTPDLLEVT